MKKTITSLKTFAFLFLMTFAFKGQSQCVANFTYNVGANGVVTFTSTSVLGSTTQPTTYYWSFGNNTTYSNVGAPGMNATVTYTANGTYVVNLFILTASTCSAGVQHTITVNSVTGSCPLSAGFGYTQGGNGLVNFTNMTSGTTSGTTYSWNFGDSNTSSSMSPSHTYASNGQYLVTMVATNNGTCAATFTAMVHVTSYCNYQAGFTYSLLSNGLVSFQSTSSGTTSGTVYKWIFGDGSQSITGPTTIHTYTNGNYMAILVLMNNTVSPSCIDSAFNNFSVTTATCNLTANWTASMSPSGGVVQFVNNSSGTTSGTTYTWNFGNGQTSNQSNPVVTYPSGGVYYVTLHASNGSNCTSSKSFTINVTSIPCIANANFTMTPSGTPQHWNATPAFPWNIANGSWTWGDGSPATGTMLTSHTYSAAGMYTICLTVTATCGATATACSTYSVYKGGQGQAIIHVNVQMPAETNIDGVIPTAIQQNDLDERVSVYPNPTSSEVNLVVSGIEGETSTIEVYSLLGDLVFKTSSVPVNGVVNEHINMKNNADGIYVLKVTTNTKAVSRKIVLDK